eukprot:TRINITY_DN33939_c0_g1_i1.p1 TRINITY_DN33939_c0_g1~~TRINITY_DN33939_c0_g1_i1.p1  ORF type:complete len:688 (+),score=129.77 TRINITY_DN33939_c0_g1_i1:34-2097(+)
MSAQLCDASASANANANAEMEKLKLLELWPGNFYDSWPSLLLSVVSLALLAFNIMAERKSFRKIWKSVAQAWSRSRTKRMLTAPSEKQERVSTLVRNMLDERRISNFRSFTAYSGTGTGFLIVFLFIVYGHETGKLFIAGEDLLALTSFYCLCLLTRFGPWPLSNTLVDKLSSAMNLALVLKLVRASSPANYWGYASARMAFRLGIGLSGMNHRIHGPWSIVISLTNAYKHVQLFEDVEAVRLHPALIVVNELFAALACWYVFWRFEMSAEKGFRSLLNARSANYEKSGVQRMLAVLCDAQVTLTAEGRMLGDCEKISQMLMHPYGKTASKLQGSMFSDFLAVEDRPRFDIFRKDLGGRATKVNHDDDEVSSSVSSEQHEKHEPAASLQVHMVDSAQLRFAVELFCVSFSAVDGAKLQLVGIRDCEGRGVTPPPSSSASIIHSELGFEIAKSSDHSIRSVDEGTNRSSLVVKPHYGEEFDVRSLTSSRSRKSSKSGSQGSDGKMRLPTLQFVNVKLDPFSNDLPITKVVLSFQSREEAQNKRDTPCFSQWLHGDVTEFVEWLRDQVNLLHCGMDPEVPVVKDLKLHMPGRADMCLIASKTEVTMHEDSEDESSDEGSGKGDEENGKEEDSSSDEALDVWISLSGFSARLHRKPKHPGLPSVRSSGSGSHLPTIQEAHVGKSRRAARP